MESFSMEQLIASPDINNNFNHNLFFSQMDESALNESDSVMSGMDSTANQHISNPAADGTPLLESDFNIEKFFEAGADGPLGSGAFQQSRPFNSGFGRHLQMKLNDAEFGGNELRLVDSNNTLVSSNNRTSAQFGSNYLDVSSSQPEFLQSGQDKFLSDMGWDFRLNQVENVSSIYGDSTTLGSESRTSNEFVDNFESINENEAISSYRSKFSLSNIFKSSSSSASTPAVGATNRFNLRVINPLSTHRNPNVLVQQLPNLVENVENLSIEHEDDQSVEDSKKKKCSRMMHAKNCDCASKKKKSTTTSIVNALTSARLGFNSNKQQQIDRLQSIDLDTVDDDSLMDESILRLSEDIPLPLDFDEELTKVISLASKNTSTYNFNSDLNSMNGTQIRSTREENGMAYFPASNVKSEESTRAYEQKLESEQIVQDEMGKADEDDETSEQSPDYAALFSDVNPTKKRSKSLSFRKMTLSQAKVPSVSVTPADEDKPVDQVIIPLKDSTRGRKPSMEYDASKTFVCTYCTRRFRRQEHLKRHFRSLHTNEKPFDCNLCGKKFSRSDNLTQHIKTHTLEDGVSV